MGQQTQSIYQRLKLQLVTWENIPFLLQKVKQLWHLAYLNIWMTVTFTTAHREQSCGQSVVTGYVCLFYISALKCHYWQPDCTDRMSDI